MLEKCPVHVNWFCTSVACPSFVFLHLDPTCGDSCGCVNYCVIGLGGGELEGRGSISRGLVVPPPTVDEVMMFVVCPLKGRGELPQLCLF